ncbi:MAG: hypothetical protein ACRC30_10975 [Clostridium sp.]
MMDKILDGQINIFEVPIKKADMEIINELGESYWKFFKKYMVTFNMILDLKMNKFSKSEYERFIYSQWGDEYKEDLTREQIELFYELSLNRIERILKINMEEYKSGQ